MAHRAERCRQATATNLQSHATSNVANVSPDCRPRSRQWRSLAVDEMRRAFDRRRLTIVEMLNAIPVGCLSRKVRSTPTRASKELFGKSRSGATITSSADLAVILGEAEVAVVPGEAFGTNGYLRPSYALSDEDPSMV